MKGRAQALGAALLLEEVTEAMIVVSDISGRVQPMELGHLKIRHPFSQTQQTLAGITRRMKGSQWTVDPAVVTQTVTKTIVTRISALILAMKNRLIGSLWRSRGAMRRRDHLVELLILATTDRETDRYVLEL